MKKLLIFLLSSSAMLLSMDKNRDNSPLPVDEFFELLREVNAIRKEKRKEEEKKKIEIEEWEAKRAYDRLSGKSEKHSHKNN